MSSKRKFNRKSKYTLSQKIISAVTAAGFIMQPFTAFAGEIIKPNGSNLIKDGVADIWADRVVDNAAINVFNKFNLSANEIANMYFNTIDKQQADAANLVNFVNSRIDINGTVNAVRNNKIDGNLFFLSKEGMAVGKSGVINTGSLYVMTPTSGFMEDIIGADGKTFNEDNFKAQWGENGNGNIAKMQIPVNPSGTITVLGTVNAANDVKMMAAQIGVGKNVSGEIKDEDGKVIMAADETNANAYIKTNITDFSDFVNIEDVNVTAGLEGNLEAQVDQNSGDIVLKAVASTVNSTDVNFDKYNGSNNQALATVTVNGTVEARKDAVITAEATNGVKLTELFSDEDVIESDDNFTEAFGQITKNVATVDINGKVTGQHVDIEANTINNFISGTNEDVNLGWLTGIAGVMAINWDASYAVLANEATVNINKGAVITAKAAAEEGKAALNISADSSLKASVGASTSAIKLANIKGTSNMPAASVGYVKADNSAEVNIAGELHSKGNTNISANADNTVELVAADTTTQLKGDPTVFNVAVAIADGSNSSSVDIKDTAQMTDLNGDLNITATSTNSIDTQALVKGKEGSFIGTAVNVTNFDSSADVKIDTVIEADSVNIAAGNSVVKNNVVADNNVGSGYFTNLVVSNVKSTKMAEDITNFAGAIKEKFLGPEKPDIQTPLNALGKWASVGVSVGVVNETNNANVTLTKNAQITAQNDAGTKGNISVTANNSIADTSMSVTGATNNYSSDESNELLVNAAVLVSDMDSNAAVTMEGGTAQTSENEKAEYTQLDGANINVQANSEFNYGRIDKMIGDILLLCEKLKGAYNDNTDYAKNVQNLSDLANTFKKNCAEIPGYADSTDGNKAALALAAAAQQVSNDASASGVTSQIKDIFAGPLSVVGMAAQFANPNNYANFQAGASTGGKSEGGATVAVSGAVNLNYITNNANVIVGKNTEITGSGKVDINASAAQEDVAFNGKLGLTGGADNAAGGTVGVHFGEVNSMVAIAEGAEVTGSAINIGADNDVAHTAITFGAGKAEGNALAGMGSYLEGDSNSIVSIDDEANLTATGREQYKNESDDKDKPTPDHITGISDGSVNITAHNNTVLTNIAGGGAMGGENAAVGASIAITDYDVYNMAGIVNNDAGVSTDTGEASDNETEDQKREIQKENIAKLQELTKTQSGLTDAEYAKLFGSADDAIANAGINAHDVNVDVLTDGTINTVTIAGSAVTGSDFDEPGIGDKFNTFKENMEHRVENGINTLDTAVQNKFNGTMKSPNLKPTDMQATNPYAGQERASFTISGAGSSSVNLIDGASTALLDGAKITLTEDKAGNAGKLNVSAADSSFIGAWGGAAAISWKTFMAEQNWNNKSVALAGTVGVNMVNTDVASIIRSSTINNAGSITNTADKSGALVAAGLGMAVEKGGAGGGNNYGGAASVSVNIAENDIYAVMQGNTVNDADNTEKTVLTNAAYDNDVQVTGGINASIALGGQQGVSVGGTVTYAELTNNVQSAIVGGTYNNMGTVDVSAVTDITQVGAAVGVAAATSTEKNYGIDGVAAYNRLNNNADAVIDGATITADKVNAAAYDTDLGENKHTEYINKRGLDATGDTYLQNISDTAEDLYEKDDKGQIKLDENGQPILKVGQTGNTIVTGALGISATTGSGGGSGSAAISISDINNDFNASIKNSTIKTNGMAAEGTEDVADVNVQAKSDTLLVNIAAGGAGASKGFAGAGSFGWSTVNNDNTASIENSTIDAATTKVNAISGTLGVNVAGQISVGKQAIGLAVAYNDLENNTGAYILGSDIINTDTNDEGNEVTGETDVTVAAENSGKMYAVGAGVGASTEQLVANGTIAINRGNNNLEAIVGDYGSGEDTRHTKITNARNIDVISNDNASVLSVAGGVGISKKVAVGGSVAYNEIGNISGKADGKIQNNTAQINNAVITTANGAAIDVQALDDAGLTTAAVGVGVAAGGNVAVQGAAATALINKATEASMNGVTISKASETSNSGADVNVKASSSNDIVTTASTVSVVAGGTGAAVGAGVAVNRSEADVKALVKGGTMDVDDLAVKAANSANITTVGVGGSVAGGTGAGVTGSVAVNLLGNDTTAKIDGGANITADNNVVVDAQSDEQIANYAGSASVAGTGAAVGLSVSVNQIDGTTNASIEGSGTQVNAAGYEDAELNNTVADGEILNEFVNSSTFDSQGSLGDKRTGKTYSGVAVSASSTHSIKSFLINAGVAGQGAGVTGTVNVNQTDGSTTAAIKDAAINQNGFAGDVNVIAHDYSNSAGIVGTAAGVGEGAGIGLGADTNTLSRDVTAEISSTENNKNNVKGNAVNVEAEAKQGVSSMAIGAAVAGIGASVGNGTTVTLVDGKTIAKISNSNITAGSLNVTAKHLDRINTNGISIGVGGLGAGIGIGVAVLNENSTTEATVENTDVTYTNADGKTVINADNTTVMNYQLYNVGGAIAGVAGSVGVANVNSKVNANVIGSDFGAADSETNKAGSIAVGAANDIDFDQTAGTAGAGAVGVGVGVSVNTIDSQVQAKVENSRLYAKGNIDVTAEETRNVDQLAVNAGVGGAAAGFNVMVTNVGEEVSNAYGTDGMEDADVEKAYVEAQEAINGGKLTSEYTLGALNDTETTDVSGSKDDTGKTNTAVPGKGATEEADKSIVKVDIDGATLNAGGNLNVTADETTNVNMTGVNAQLGVVGSGAGTVGVLNVHRNSGVEITSAMLDAADVDIKAIQSGISKLDIYQGTGALGNTLGAAYGTVNSEGKTGVGIGSSTITSDKDVDITASDESRTAVNAIGVSVAAGSAASVIVAQGSNEAETTVTVDETDIAAETNNINIHAERQAKDENGNKLDTLSVSAKAASGGLVFAGVGVGATADELGKVGVEVTGGSNFTAGKAINITALNAPSVKAETGSLSASMIASGALTVAEANIGTHIETEDKENENKEDNGHLKTIVNISDGNSFTAKSLTAQAKADAVQNVTMEGMSISAALWPTGSVQANTGGANAYSDVTVTVGENVFKDNGNDENAEGIDLIIKGINNVTQTASAKGISVSTFFASGTNIAQTNSVLNTNVTVDGEANRSNVDDDTKYINNVDISAESTANINNSSRGDGGAVVDVSPYAAMTENDINSTTNVTVNGTWNIAGHMTVGALHENNININTDALKAAVVGLSGVYSDNKIINNTSVNFNNANVTTTGNQKISARNDIDYTADIQGSGYGVASGAAVLAQDEITSNANVNVTGSQLKADGSITMDALTGEAYYDGVDKPEASVNKEVTIKSAGVVAGTYAESNDTVKFNNNINVGAGSTIATVGTETSKADITLTAADRTNFTDITTADTQGGVIGAAGTKLTNNIIRTNNITVGGTVDSNYDANFDAGDSSVLNLTLKSNAYNKTAAPLATIPSISGTMTQNSSIAFETGSIVKSLRNINAAAGVGDTTIAKESKTWRWVDGGETGTGSIASTSDGTLSGDDAVINTTVTVDGSLEAGKNHKLDITINYADGGKEDMEAAFNEYGSNKGFDKFENALKEAQEAYEENDYVVEMTQKSQELAAKEAQLLNDTNVKNQLSEEVKRLGDKLTEANNAAADKFDVYNDYVNEYWLPFDEKQSNLPEAEQINRDQFIATYLAGKQDYESKLDDYNKAAAEVNSLKEKISDRNGTIADYENSNKYLQEQIGKLEKRIEELGDLTEEQRLTLQNMKDAYEKYLADNITEDLVNSAVFKGQLGDKEGDYVTIKVPDWYKEQYGSAAEQIGMIDYAASLLKRMDKLIQMSQEYTGTDVGKAYTAELTRIQSDLQALGLLTVDSEGNIGIAQGASSVPTIELKDLLVSGGNVNISADTLNSAKTGSITAHGNPSVSITNNTDFFLRVNDVKIAGDGGSIKYNDAALTEDVFNGTIKAEQGSGKAKISINNTSGTSKSDELTQYDETLYTPDIGIYGEIYNPYGNIEITNAHNNIYVAGEVKDEDGNVTQKAGSIVGQTINLTAGGSVTQGYSDEIYNAAGDPKNALSTKYITAIQNALIAALGETQHKDGKYYAAFNTVEDLAEFLTGMEVNGEKLGADEALQAAKQLTGQTDNSKPNMAAGGAIYINAASINVNGTIQSGFEDYKLDINETKAAQLIEAGNTTGKDNLTYEDFMTDTWRVTADGHSGAYYDEDSKTFVYGIQAWYNPITNEIFTEDIEQAGGGRIYLTGAIANTNASGGKLVVLDGGSKYYINGSVGNQNNYTFKLGSINAETVEGRIEINDTLTGNKVVYGRDSITTYDENGNVIENGTNTTTTYNPTEGLYYNWSNGTSNRVTTSYKHVSDSSWWGLKEEYWDDVVGQLDEVTKDQMIDTTFGENGVEVSDNEPLYDKGNVISDGTINAPTDDDKYIQFGYDNLGADGKPATSQIAGSSEKTDNSNIYQILFERKGQPKQGVAADGKTLLWLDAEGNITEENTGIPYYLTTKDKDGNVVYVYETVISDKVTTTKKKGLLGLWGKTVTTEWKETSGMITAYNFGLKADNSIGIEFVGNETSTGKITSNSDILLGGDIHMGQVDITSTTGKIYHEGDATVISDNASFKAYDDIDVIQKNVNEALRLKAESTNGGDINIQAVAANANDMVYIKNVSTGEGNVNITAEGSLLNYHDNETSMTAQTPVVIGDSINLQSYGGSIGMETDRLLIDGDVSYVANSDKKHGAISTNAAGSVYLTEVNGNMYLGEIVAENGDVVLEVKENNAGFVDAIENNSNGNKDDNRVAEWKKLGLLGGTDEDDTINSWKNQIANLEQTASNGSMFMKDGTSVEDAQKQGAQLVDAGKDFATLMQGGSDAVKAAREELNAKQGTLNKAIAALGNDDTSKQNYKDALEAYNSAYDKYETVGAAYEQQKANFIENSGFKDNAQAVEWLYNYEAIRNAEADNYGWTQQQLLYAVQDTVINPEAGSVSDVKTANVTGNNITFISNTGKLGVVDTGETTIVTDELTAMFTKTTLTDEDQAMLDKLDKLASARAGDVTWGEENITIKRTTPVSVKLNSDGGTVTVEKNSADGKIADHIYLLAKDSVLNADEFAANDLRLSGQEGLNVGSVTGEKIYLEGGSGDIGHKVNDALQAVQVTLTNNGYVSANTAGNIKLQQILENPDEIVDFTLGSIAGTNVDITANGNIVSKADDIGYINASDTINLVSAGGIGTTTKGLRIKNSGAVVNTDVQDAISIEAVQDGTLILGTIEQTKGGVTVESEGTIMLGRENDAATTEDESVTGSIDAKDDVTLHAENDIIISGKLHVNATSNDGTLQLHSNTGDIVQTTDKEDKNIVAANVGIAAVGGLICRQLAAALGLR